MKNFIKNQYGPHKIKRSLKEPQIDLCLHILHTLYLNTHNASNIIGVGGRFILPTMTLAIPIDLKKKMDSFPELNWSAIARQAFQQKVYQQEILNQVTNQTQNNHSTNQTIEEKESIIDSTINNSSDTTLSTLTKQRKVTSTKETLTSKDNVVNEKILPKNEVLVEQKQAEAITEEDEKMLFRRMLLKRLAKSEE